MILVVMSGGHTVATPRVEHVRACEHRLELSRERNVHPIRTGMIGFDCDVCAPPDMRDPQRPQLGGAHPDPTGGVP
ncbi:hypothetical protein GCM10020255_031530 [Rhodococcus baikonurensis]